MVIILETGVNARALLVWVDAGCVILSLDGVFSCGKGVPLLKINKLIGVWFLTIWSLVWFILLWVLFIRFYLWYDL